MKYIKVLYALPDHWCRCWSRAYVAEVRVRKEEPDKIEADYFDGDTVWKRTIRRRTDGQWKIRLYDTWDEAHIAFVREYCAGIEDSIDDLASLIARRTAVRRMRPGDVKPGCIAADLKRLKEMLGKIAAEELRK